MTWRYSAKHEEVKKARNLVSEAWLVETLNRMTEEVRFSVGKHATVKGRKTRENKSFAKNRGERISGEKQRKRIAGQKRGKVKN